MQANDVRRGMALMYNGVIHVVTEVVHRTPGNLRAFVQMTFKNINTGQQIQNRFSSTQDVDQVYLEPRRVQFLYSDGSGYHFLDMQDYNTFVLSEDFVAEAKYYVKENMEVDLDVHDGKSHRVENPLGIREIALFDVTVGQFIEIAGKQDIIDALGIAKIAVDVVPDDV